MPQQKRKTKAQLSAMYPEKEWRRNFIRLLHVASLLRSSIIRHDYRIPDDFNNALFLTQHGQETAKTLTTKHDVPYKEAKLMCFLVVAYQDLLVDVEKTNYPVVVDEISKQVRAGEIRHPHIFGRTLYDRAADLFVDERRYLSVNDTVKLLEGTPNGVFQVGELITGPFGIIKSGVKRMLVPHTEVPLQHCPDLSCDRIHYVQLTTDYEAPINTHRPKLSRLLEQGGQEPSDWNGFIDDLLKEERGVDAPSDDLDQSGIVYLLGDGLADEELGVFFELLLDSTGSELRDILATHGISGKAGDIVAKLDRAKLLQLTLVRSDDEVVRALDECVLTGKILVPHGEVRRAQVNSHERSGPWGLQAELGPKGVRFGSSSGSSLPMLRLHRLIGGLYDTDKVEDMQTLDWNLRGIDAVTPAAKLAEYLRIESPQSVVRNLVLARRENAEYARVKLGLPALDDLSDDEIVYSILWKLGFRIERSEAPHARYFRRQDEILRLATEARLSSTVDEEPIRKAAAVFFEDLEALLDDCLAYATWAMLTDHYASERPYVFRPVLDTQPAMARLSLAARQQVADPANAVQFKDQNTLYPLVRGFGILAHLLEMLRKDGDSLLRESEHLPSYLEYTDLQTFPFLHVHPFLDIQANAQVAIIEQLTEISRLLLSHDVPEIRNSLAHFRRTTVDIEKVIAGLEAVAQAVRQINSLGFLRTPFIQAATRSDEWGRRTLTLMGTDGQMVSFTRPSPFDWLPLPRLTREQYLMHAALFAEPNEVLRFVPGFDSPYQDMWTNYPRRRAVKDNSVAKQSEHEVGEVDPTGRRSTRSG